MRSNVSTAIQIELRHLRYVVAVADHLHFGHAADWLHLAAPSLSKQIKQLETILGYPLFERRTRQVGLTKAGVAFVAEARDALNHVALALNRSAAANSAESVTVAVGYSPWIDLPWLVEARDRLSREIGVTVALRSEYTASQMASILAGSLHAGIVILPVEAPGIAVEIIRREDLLLALPEIHVLAKSETIALKAIGAEPFISVNASLEPALSEHLLRICKQNGFTPKVVHEVSGISEALALVGSSMGSALVTASYAAQGHRVVFRKCTDPELFVEIGLVHRTEHRPLAIEHLVRLLRNGAESPNSTNAPANPRSPLQPRGTPEPCEPYAPHSR